MKPPVYLRTRFFNKALIRNNGIARRIMLAVILFSSAITTVITGVELYADYRTDLRGIDERVESIRRVYLPTLTESVWVADADQIRNQLQGLLNLGDIEYLSITADGREQWSAGRRLSTRHTETRIPLHRYHRTEEITIGELLVVANIDNVLQRLWSKLLATLVSNAIKTFLVTVFVMLIFQAMVGQHLEHISGYLRSLGASGTEPGALRLNRPVTGRWRPDALDHVTQAVNRLREDIRSKQASLEASNRHLRDVIDNAPLAIITRDAEGLVTSWNPAAEQMFGWSAEEARGTTLPAVNPDEVVQRRANHDRVRQGEVLKQIEVTRRHRDGQPLLLSLSLAPMRHADGEFAGFMSIMADITERRRVEQEARFLAFHDALTRLPNHQLLQEHYTQAQSHAQRNGSRLALLAIDLDNFKDVNDTLGHEVGDALLCEIAQRLRSCLRDSDTLGRQGGDEFLLLLSDLHHADDAMPALAKIMEEAQRPFHHRGHEISLSASIGVAMYPQDGQGFDTLRKQADVALYRAKDAGRNTYRFFDAGMNREADGYLSMRNGLRRGLARDEFRLHYQPQIDLNSRQIVGVEALLRWQHPTQGLLGPDRFIPIAEESGLIVPIGEWVLQEASRQAMAWQKQGLPALTMAVNMSAVQFRRGQVEQAVIQALQRSGLQAAHLELELTESILIDNAEAVLETLRRLKHLGVKLSIDDFGTGYSSLAYLKRFDVDKLKIDKSFVRDLGTDPDDAAIVRAVVQMARSLELQTIAEGVETGEMAQMLRIFQCDVAQGYHYARPMPADEFATFLRQHSPSMG